MNRAEVFDAIDSERYYQDRKWGTPSEHPHEVGGYLTLMDVHLQRAKAAWAGANNDNEALEALRKVLAIGVACAEQHGMRGAPARSRSASACEPMASTGPRESSMARRYLTFPAPGSIVEIQRWIPGYWQAGQPLVGMVVEYIAPGETPDPARMAELFPDERRKSTGGRPLYARPTLPSKTTRLVLMAKNGRHWQVRFDDYRIELEVLREKSV